MKFSDLFKSNSVSSDALNISNEKILASLLVMAWVVEARDPYTGGHLWRVSRFSRLLAERAGLSDEQTARIEVGGFLHDLGKVGIPDAILNKPDKLSDAEYEVIKTHPELGRRMLVGHPFSPLALDAVFLHHETPDGKGYPGRLTQSNIPDVALIVGICDAFDAMTSTRPYRRGMPVEKAMQIIRENLDGQFDRRFGEVFVALENDPELKHIVGHSDVGIPIQECGMCGPTVVLERGTKAGDLVYCRCCTAEYKVKHTSGHHSITATGGNGGPGKLEPRPDEYVIHQVVENVANAVNLNKILADQ